MVLMPLRRRRFWEWLCMKKPHTISTLSSEHNALHSFQNCFNNKCNVSNTQFLSCEMWTLNSYGTSEFYATGTDVLAGNSGIFSGAPSTYNVLSLNDVMRCMACCDLILCSTWTDKIKYCTWNEWKHMQIIPRNPPEVCFFRQVSIKCIYTSPHY